MIRAGDMQNPLKKVSELIPVLPKKDAKLCADYLNKRNFEAILEIVKSDIYKANRDKTDDSIDDYISTLIELEGELLSYMSMLDVPDNSDNYDDY